LKSRCFYRDQFQRITERFDFKLSYTLIRFSVFDGKSTEYLNLNLNSIIEIELFLHTVKSNLNINTDAQIKLSIKLKEKEQTKSKKRVQDDRNLKLRSSKLKLLEGLKGNGR
jgi:hypothetical protein